MSSFINNGMISISLACLITSCATLRKAELVKEEVALTIDNIKLLNGTFQRESVDTTWCALAHNDLSKNFYLTSHKGNRVSLLVLDKKHIRMTLLDGLDTTKSKVFSGKIKKGHFELKRRVKFMPAVIFNHFWNSKTRLGISNKGNLTIDSKWIFFGHVAIFPAADNEIIYDAEHSRIN